MKGSSKNIKNYAIIVIEIKIPIMKPKMIELRLFAMDSYTLILMTSFLVMPIDLRTPNSHIESLILALIVTIN